MIGKTISHYRVLEKIGAGGMGEVYRAQDLRLHRQVALKMLLEEMCRDAEAKSRFLREAQAASALNHPNIATIYSVEETPRDRCVVIVMELVSGSTLDEFARRNRLDTSVVLSLVAQIADALAEAHQKGIVHRDIKPSNIIVSDNQRVKVLDFGLAKLRSASRKASDLDSEDETKKALTIPGTVMGTFAYMSPEQALGQEVDPRSDIFSLGVLLYELLTGQLPFRGPSSIAVVDKLLHSHPLAPTVVNTKLPPEADSICGRMLEKDRNRRYQSMREVHTDLQSLQMQVTYISGRSGSDYSLEGTLYLTDSSSALLRSSSFNSRRGKSLAVITFANITKNTDDDWLGNGIAETVTADLKNIEGITVIGRERIYEVLRHLEADRDSGLDEKMATRVGREVGARWIVGGGYQRMGEQLRITARFVDVETGEVIQTVKIDGRMEKIFELQDKIVYELSRNLEMRLRTTERRDIEQEETHVLPAYEAFTKGMMNLRLGSTESLDRAVLLFEQAISLDPEYARAYSALGAAYELKAEFLAIPELLDRAVDCYQRSIELNPRLSSGYRGLGMVFLYRNQIDESVGAIRRSLALAPDDFGGHAALGRALFLGKGDFSGAAEMFEKALGQNPKAGWVALQLAYCYALLGEMKKGEEAALIAVEMQENFLSGKEGMQILGAHARLGYIYYLQDRFDEAIAEYKKELDYLYRSNHALKDRSQIEVRQKLAGALLRRGDHAEAKNVFEEVIQGFRRRLASGADDPATRYYVACAYAMMGQTEEALESLERALGGRRQFTIERARIDRDLESLRTEPRFQELVGTDRPPGGA